MGIGEDNMLSSDTKPDALPCASDLEGPVEKYTHPIAIYSPRSGNWHGLVAELDSGSKENWISQQIVDRLRLKVLKGTRKLYTTFGGEEVSSDAIVKSTWISGKENGNSHEHVFRVIEKAPFDVLFGINLLNLDEVKWSRKRDRRDDSQNALAKEYEVPLSSSDESEPSPKQYRRKGPIERSNVAPNRARRACDSYRASKVECHHTLDPTRIQDLRVLKWIRDSPEIPALGISDSLGIPDLSDFDTTIAPMATYYLTKIIDEDFARSDISHSVFSSMLSTTSLKGGRNPETFSWGVEIKGRRRYSNSSSITQASSLPSTVDSLFSTGTAASSVSSIMNTSSAGDQLLMLFHEDSVLKPLYSEALSKVAVEKLERNLRRLFKQFGAELRKEAENAQQRGAARFVCCRARNAARIICELLDHKSRSDIVPQEAVGDNSDNGSDSDNEEEENGIFLESEAFVVGSRAFRELRTNLGVFVHFEGLAFLLSCKDIIDNTVGHHSSNHPLDFIAGARIEEVPILDLDFAEIGTLFPQRPFILEKSPDYLDLHSKESPGEILTLPDSNWIASRKVLGPRTKIILICNICYITGILLFIFVSALHFPNLDFEGLASISTFLRTHEWRTTGSERIVTTSALLSAIFTLCLVLFIHDDELYSVKFSFKVFNMEPRITKGTIRVRWKCTCGQNLYDDFTELTDGAAQRLQDHLNRSHSASNSSLKSGLSFSSLSSTVSTLMNSLMKALKQKETELPQYEAQTDPNERPESSLPPSTEPLFLLLCHNEGVYAKRLLQLSICDLKSDKKLFSVLRTNYRQMRSKWWSFFCFRTLIGIKFVNSLVDIRERDAIPPPERAGPQGDYRYTPAPPEIIPPVGENHLMHLFQHPQHAEDEPVCLERFPKKLRERLAVCGTAATGLGWGLSLEEGWDCKKTWVVGFVIFAMGSALWAVLWMVFEKNIQDAFAVAAYMVSFAVVTVGFVQALVSGLG